ncbi:MAG: aminotransferase class III-fold pyridoxal phosphate-dependent enzyme [Euryarchaeota archaeon]|nr:aminotransferase class III-fold pyridoxal phosphate-dependent enzyme [Euryarchaeota archaeon]
MKNVRSGALHFEAKRYLPDGVSMPSWSFEPYPNYIQAGRGPYVTDVDGNDLIDYRMGSGALILGHARREVTEAVKQQLELGAVFDAPTEKELKMAKLIGRSFPSMEMMRFCGSEAEAKVRGVRVAQSYTGRKKVMSIGGALPSDMSSTVPVPFNDLDTADDLMRQDEGGFAAVALEPLATINGLSLPAEGYLQGIRDIATDHGALLMFDETTTGFRLAKGGAQQFYRVVPDITVLGRTAGGGLPFGAFGASREVMTTRHAGRRSCDAFAGNPLSLAAGIETLRIIGKEGHDDTNARGEELRKGIESVINELHLGFHFVGEGSMFQLFLANRSFSAEIDAGNCDLDRYAELSSMLMNKGVCLTSSQFGTNFLSTSHDRSVIERTVDIFTEALLG